MYRRVIRSALMAPEPQATSQRSSQFPPVDFRPAWRDEACLDPEGSRRGLAHVDVEAVDFGAGQLVRGALRLGRASRPLDSERLRRIGEVSRQNERPTCQHLGELVGGRIAR